jgi:hypothetical protein
MQAASYPPFATLRLNHGCDWSESGNPQKLIGKTVRIEMAWLKGRINVACSTEKHVELINGFGQLQEAVESKCWLCETCLFFFQIPVAVVA